MKILGLVAIVLWWLLPVPLVISELKDKNYLTAALIAAFWIVVNTIYALACLGFLPSR